MAIKIRYDIPLPPAGGGRPAKYPVAELRVDGMFEVPCADKRRAKSIRSCIRSAAKRCGYEIRIRPTANGIGVWRIA